jgi:hypothetical protein
MVQRTLGEILEKQQKLIKIPDKIQNLKENDSPALRYLLALAHSDIEWALPEGAPPFKPDPGPHGMTPSNLIKEMRTLYLYLKGGNDNLNQLRREQLFQQLLERVHKTEAEVLIAIKDKKFVNKYRVPKSVVEEAFPGLLAQAVSVKFFLR